MRRLCLLGLALAAACSDALEQTSSAGQVIAIVNSADNSVSFVSAKDLSVRTVDLQTPAGRGTTAAGRGRTVVVPLGPADSVAVINNAGLCSAGLCVRPVVVFPLATGSGATGVAIQDDSIASIKTKGLIGEKYIRISPGGSDKIIPPNGRIREVEAPIDLEELISKYIFGKV